MSLSYQPKTNENISTTNFRHYYGNMFEDKIIEGLEISALSEGFVIRVSKGSAIVDGLFYRLNQDTKLTLSKNTSSTSSTYYVVLRVDNDNINSPVSLTTVNANEVETNKETGIYDFLLAKVTFNLTDVTLTENNIEILETVNTENEPWYVILTNTGTVGNTTYALLNSFSIVSSSSGFKSSDITLGSSASVRFNIKGIFSIQYEIYTADNNGTKYSGSRVYCHTSSDYVLGQHENRSITCSTNVSSSVTLNTYEGDTAINAYIYNNQSQKSIGVLYITKIG